MAFWPDCVRLSIPIEKILHRGSFDPDFPVTSINKTTWQTGIFHTRIPRCYIAAYLREQVSNAFYREEESGI